MAQTAKRGAFILFEGCDRVGKSTQCRLISEALAKKGHKVEPMHFPDRTTAIGKMINEYLKSRSDLDDRAIHLHERGNVTRSELEKRLLWICVDRTTAIGKMINEYLKSRSDLDDRAIHLLFSANRWELSSKMKELLLSDTTLIVDRYSYSGVAFSAAKGLDLDWCAAPERGLLAPDLVIELAMKNADDAKERGGFGDERYETNEMQRQVAKNFELFRSKNSSSENWKVVDASRSIEEVAADVETLVLTVAEDHKYETLSHFKSLVVDASRSIEEVAADVEALVLKAVEDHKYETLRHFKSLVSSD